MFLTVMAVIAMAAQDSKVLFDNPDAAMLSWSSVCTVSAADVEGIQAGDVIEVTVTEVKDGCEWPKFGFEANGKSNYPEAFEMWTRRDNLPYVAKFVVTEADIDLLKDGFDIKGDGVKITRVVFTQTVKEDVPEGQTVLFNNEDAPMLSWSVACSVTAAQVSGIKAGDIFEVTVTEVKDGCEWPKFGFEADGKSNYPEAFEMWTRRDNLPYVAKFVVTEADIDLLKNGFDLKGDGVKITRVVFVQTPKEDVPEGQTVLFNNEDAPMLSWSVACSVTAAQVSGIKAGDAFQVTVAAVKAGCEWPKFGFEADGKSNYPEAFEMWGDKTFPYVATYDVTEADVELLKNGFDIKGDGVQITRVVFVRGNNDDEGELVLWSGNPTEVSWGAPGPSVSEGKAAGIKAGDILAVTVSEIKAGVQWPKVVCRNASSWEEIFTIELWGDGVGAEMPFVKNVVVTEEMVPALTGGFNFGGEGASIEKVALVKESGVIGISAESEDAMVDVYTVSGICVRRGVNASEATTGLPAGIYIAGGRKIAVK